jgi:hypothetical protein
VLLGHLKTGDFQLASTIVLILPLVYPSATVAAISVAVRANG